jgi:hypothetical protein
MSMPIETHQADIVSVEQDLVELGHGLALRGDLAVSQDIGKHAGLGAR